MRTTEELERIGKIVAGVWGAAVIGAQLLVHAGNGVGVSHFALFLVSQSWPEIVGGGVLYSGYRLTMYMARGLAAERNRWGGPRLVSALLKWPNVLAVAVCTASLVTLPVPLYYVCKARAVYWVKFSRKAYVQQYAVKIDALAGSGRIGEAAELATVVTNAPGRTTEKDYLARRIVKLKGALERSNHLVLHRATGRWNPTTQRVAFFGLAEAVRVNPQNYSAADRLKEMIRLLDTHGPMADLEALCKAGGAFDDYRGHAMSLLEAKVWWLERGSRDGCQASYKDVLDVWQLGRINCVLAWSDATRAPLHDSKSDKEVPDRDSQSCIVRERSTR